MRTTFRAWCTNIFRPISVDIGVCVPPFIEPAVPNLCAIMTRPWSWGTPIIVTAGRRHVRVCERDRWGNAFASERVAANGNRRRALRIVICTHQLSAGIPEARTGMVSFNGVVCLRIRDAVIWHVPSAQTVTSSVSLSVAVCRPRCLCSCSFLFCTDCPCSTARLSLLSQPVDRHRCSFANAVVVYLHVNASGLRVISVLFASRLLLAGFRPYGLHQPVKMCSCDLRDSWVGVRDHAPMLAETLCAWG